MTYVCFALHEHTREILRTKKKLLSSAGADVAGGIGGLEDLSAPFSTCGAKKK